MKRLSALALATALALLSAAPKPGHAQQQVPAGQSEVQQDIDKRIMRVTLPGERAQARCYSGVLIDAFQRYGVFGTIDTMPAELINLIPAGANAVLYYCNENYAVCQEAAKAYLDRLGMAPETCS